MSKQYVSLGKAFRLGTAERLATKTEELAKQQEAVVADLSAAFDQIAQSLNKTFENIRHNQAWVGIERKSVSVTYDVRRYIEDQIGDERGLPTVESLEKIQGLKALYDLCQSEDVSCRVLSSDDYDFDNALTVRVDASEPFKGIQFPRREY